MLSCVGPFDYMFFDQLQIMMNQSLAVEDKEKTFKAKGSLWKRGQRW